MTVPAFRYIDGKLAPCENVGHRMRVAITPQARLNWFPADECPRRPVGIYAADLDREAHLPGGPPTWFAPNLSRRKRWVMWSRLSQLERLQRKPQPYAPTKTVDLDGHLFADGNRQALLYLPVGVEPTEQHAADLDRVATSAWRALAVPYLLKRFAVHDGRHMP